MAGWLPTSKNRREELERERLERAAKDGAPSLVDQILGRGAVPEGANEIRKEAMEKFRSEKKQLFKQHKLDIIERQKTEDKTRQRIDLRYRRDPDFALETFNKWKEKTDKAFEKSHRAATKKLNEDRKDFMHQKTSVLREQARTSTLGQLRNPNTFGSDFRTGTSLKSGPGSQGQSRRLSAKFDNPAGR